MNYVEIEKFERKDKWNMGPLHSHSNYELYFLLSGNRQFFLKDILYKLEQPCILIIPPYVMHKTEGDAFKRININVFPDYLDAYQLYVLNKLSGKILLPKKQNQILINDCLEKLLKFSISDDIYKNEKIKSIFSFLIYILDSLGQEESSECNLHIKNTPPIILKLINYINENYNKDISLDYLSKQFYLSKTTLCKEFKKSMSCTINEYILKNKINKAKELLTNSRKSIEEISEIAGFSSANYMGLIFKSKIGISPLQYRNLQKSKQ